MMNKQYKIAFIGGSYQSIAGYPHFIASQMDGRFKIIAGAFSTDSKINKETAQKWGIKKIYDDWEKLIQNEKKRLDAMVILTPTPAHFEIIIKVLKENIPIICEKALVSSLNDIEEIEKLYNPNQHYVAVTNNYSGYLMVRELRERIKNNDFGKILNLELEMPQESFLRPPKSVKYPQKWRLIDQFIPTISLDLGAHLHHLAYFLTTEEPVEVLANFNKFSRYNVVDDVTMLLKYHSGMIGKFWFSKIALGNRNGLKIRVFGEKGSAVWYQEVPEKLELAFSNGEKTTIDRGSEILVDSNPLYNRMTPGHPSGFIEAFANLYNDIADSLKEFKQNKTFNNPNVYGFEHAKNGIKLLHMASQANEKKTWVEI